MSCIKCTFLVAVQVGMTCLQMPSGPRWVLRCCCGVSALKVDCLIIIEHRTHQYHTTVLQAASHLRRLGHEAFVFTGHHQCRPGA